MKTNYFIRYFLGCIAGVFLIFLINYFIFNEINFKRNLIEGISGMVAFIIFGLIADKLRKSNK